MKITIRYDLRLYSRACIEQAAIAYSDFTAKIIPIDDLSLEVTLSTDGKNSEKELAHLAGEFNNCVLS